MDYNLPAHMNTTINLQDLETQGKHENCTIVSQLKHSYSLYGRPAPPSTQRSPKLSIQKQNYSMLINIHFY